LESLQFLPLPKATPSLRVELLLVLLVIIRTIGMFARAKNVLVTTFSFITFKSILSNKRLVVKSANPIPNALP
jgi:hypothetical protein